MSDMDVKRSVDGGQKEGRTSAGLQNVVGKAARRQERIAESSVLQPDP